MEITKKYEFDSIDITHNDRTFDFVWCGNKGFGHFTLSNIDGRWEVDTECMSENFIQELLIEAAPAFSKLLKGIEEKNRGDPRGTCSAWVKETNFCTLNAKACNGCMAVDS